MSTALTFLETFWRESVWAFWLTCMALGFIGELVYPAERHQPLRRKLTNVTYSLLYCAVIFLAAPTVYSIVRSLTNEVHLGVVDLSFLRDSGVHAQIGLGLVSLALGDFFYYWFHRAQHALPLLWDQHVVHHSDESLNVTTNTRHHWLEFVFQAFAVSLPVAVLITVPPVTMWVVATAMGSWQFLIHANVRIRLGWLSWVVAGPQVHRIHHSRLPEHSNKNFAAYFPLWDVVFGTFYRPGRNEFPPSGTDQTIRGVVKLATWPFTQWLGRARQRLFQRRSASNAN